MATKRTPKNAPAATPTVEVTETPTAEIFKAESRTGMEFTYETVEAPVIAGPSRETKPNPHAAGVAKAVEFYKEDEASKTEKPRALTIKVPTAEVKQHTNWLRKAGADADVTVLVYPVAVEGTELTSLTFRAVKRITRNRKLSATVATMTTPEDAGDTPETAATPDQTGF